MLIDDRPEDLAEVLARGGASEAIHRLSALLMMADQPFFYADLTTATWVWSRAVELHLGHHPRALARSLGRWRSYVHPDDQERVARHLVDALSSGAEVYMDRLRVARRDGTFVPVLVRAAIHRENGRAVAAIGALTIEGDFHPNEQRLDPIGDLPETSADPRFEERRFEIVTQTVSDGVYEFEPATQRVHLSPGMRKLFGYGERTIDDAYVWWLARVHPDDRPGVDGSSEAFMRGGSEDRWTASYRFRCADGRFVTVRDRAFAIRDRAGAPIRLIGALSVVADGARASSRPTVRLTPRQAEVLDLVRSGSTSKEIAARLGISEQGVKEHVSRLLRRFGAPNRAALVTAAEGSHVVVRDGVTRGS